jgi:hypothetical protein
MLHGRSDRYHVRNTLWEMCMKFEDWLKAVYTQDVIKVLILGTQEEREKMTRAIQERLRKDLEDAE